MIDRSKAPQQNEKVNFTFPEIKIFKPINNIEIYFVKKEKLPIVYLNLTFDAGSKFDINEKKGVAYLTSQLIDEGAGEFDALQLSDEFEKLGSIFSSSVSHDCNDFTLLSLNENFNYSFYLLSKILTEPHLTQKDFDREKNKLINKITQLKDDASFIASSVFERLIFKNTFYELPEIGLMSSASKIDLDDVKDFYKNYIASNHFKIFVVGNLEENHLLDSINKNLANLNSFNKNKINFIKPEPLGKNFYVVDKKDSPQTEIRIGHISKERKSNDYYATKIMNTILGGQFSSRINLNLREKNGYTYGASSSFGYYKYSGIFEISTAVNIENTSNALKEIFEEIACIKENIKQEEIDFAKSYLIKEFPSKFESYSQIGKIIDQLVFHSLPLDEIKEYQSKIENVTLSEVLESARQNLLTDNLTIVAVGDKNKIIQQIENEFNVTPILLDNEGNVI